MSSNESMPFESGIRGFVSGAGAVFRGLGRLGAERELRKLAVLPITITAVIYALLIGCAAFFSGDVLGLIWDRPDAGWMVALWYVASALVFAVTLGLLALMFFAIIGVVAGPFYEKMAARVLQGHAIQTKEGGIIDGIISAVLRLLIFAVPALIFAGLALIPYVGLVFLPIATIIGWLGLAAEVSEPTLVAASYGTKQRLAIVFRRFMPMLGVGMVLGLSLLIPLVPLLSIPAAIIGVADLYGRSAVRT